MTNRHAPVLSAPGVFGIASRPKPTRIFLWRDQWAGSGAHAVDEQAPRERRQCVGRVAVPDPQVSPLFLTIACLPASLTRRRAKLTMLSQNNVSKAAAFFGVLSQQAAIFRLKSRTHEDRWRRQSRQTWRTRRAGLRSLRDVKWARRCRHDEHHERNVSREQSKVGAFEVPIQSPCAQLKPGRYGLLLAGCQNCHRQDCATRTEQQIERHTNGGNDGLWHLMHMHSSHA